MEVIRGDGALVINSHYVIQADDGTKIYLHNNRDLVPAAPGEARSDHGSPQPGYFCFSPTFVVPQGPHD